MSTLLEAHGDLPLIDHHVGDRVDEVAEDVLGLGGRVAVAEPLAEETIEAASRSVSCRSQLSFTAEESAFMWKKSMPSAGAANAEILQEITPRR